MKIRSLLAAGAAVASIGLGLSVSSPATAAPAPEQEPVNCWTDIDTNTTECAPLDEDLDALVMKKHGVDLTDTTRTALSAQDANSAAATLVAELYIDANYKSVGGVWRITTSHLAGCSDGTSFSKSDFGTQNSYYNNRVSSFRSFSGCTTTLYDNANFSGASISGTSRATLGAMNDAANSARIR